MESLVVARTCVVAGVMTSYIDGNPCPSNMNYYPVKGTFVVQVPSARKCTEPRYAASGALLPASWQLQADASYIEEISSKRRCCSHPVLRLFSARLSVLSLHTLLAASLLAKLLPLDVDVASLMLLQ